jgi:putative membrane protein
METQPERTALSWQRSGLGILAVAGLIGHGAVRDQDTFALGAAGLAALLGLLVLGGLAPGRYRQLSRDPAGGAPARAITAVVVLVAVLAAFAVLTRP